ncbi:uncharacterized protein TrAFT101_002879 [Trichoderma asperellum]|uniref:uncharacterized protein n=1 Tax=Trichoderma asperellum TaxID=101201 RepID=UPI00331F61AB|nr:hypothetical protein TrAFT101_002879 [Trichoderma asperellum]
MARFRLEKRLAAYRPHVPIHFGYPSSTGTSVIVVPLSQLSALYSLFVSLLVSSCNWADLTHCPASAICVISNHLGH